MRMKVSLHLRLRFCFEEPANTPAFSYGVAILYVSRDPHAADI
jgi:hypothetical protein